MRFFFDSRASEYDLAEDTSSPQPHSPVGAVASRLGPKYAARRILSERQQEARGPRLGSRLNFREGELSAFLIHATLIASGLYRRGARNAARVEVRRNHIASPKLPRSFGGFTLLHLSDLHADVSLDAIRQVACLVTELRYDACVLTGDFRGKTYGPSDSTLEALSMVTRALKGPLFAVLGNHDPIAMVHGLEAQGIRVLLNERVAIERGSERIHIAGIDDAHFFGSDSIEKAAEGIPADEFSVLLSHTPEVYREAEQSDFDVMLSGHTHGGQICLPGGIPITIAAKLPRHMGKGAWRHGKLRGYTSVGAGSSVVPVRFNCPPEITLHRFEYVG
jgi:predicted MPP superfamily phosphohydrolase